MRGEASPALCFPLLVGKHWQGLTNSEFAWTVDGIGTRGFHMITRTAGSGGTEHLWFRKGVGITGRWYWHNGTYTENRSRLVDWHTVLK